MSGSFQAIAHGLVSAPLGVTLLAGDNITTLAGTVVESPKSVVLGGDYVDVGLASGDVGIDLVGAKRASAVMTSHGVVSARGADPAAFLAAFVGLALAEGAFMAEIIRSALLSVDAATIAHDLVGAGGGEVVKPADEVRRVGAQEGDLLREADEPGHGGIRQFGDGAQRPRCGQAVLMGN